MSALPQPKPTIGADEQRTGSSHQINVALMKRMGSKNGYNPMPPAQHRWQMAEKGGPGLHRLWSWMCAHTIEWGHRTEYATSADGDELHIDHAARDLGMDEANARAYWREGQRIGVFRYGTPKEGKRRLYLCGELKPQAVEDDPESPGDGLKQVCTYLLPPYLLNKIKEFPTERQREFWSAYGTHAEVRKDVTAELVAAARMVLDQDEDTLLRSFGLERERQEHARKVDPDHLRARSERLATIHEHVSRYVRTVEVAVQTSRTGTNNAESDLVQLNSAAATLLPSETARESQSMRASSANGSRLHQGHSHSNEGKKHKQVHTVEQPAATATAAEKQTAAAFLTQYALWQVNHPKKFEGETVDPEHKGHFASALKIVRAVGIEKMPDFESYVERRVLKNSLGHRLGFPLVVSEWPGDFHRDAAREERERVAAAELEQKRGTFQAAATKRLEFENAVAAEITRRWEGLTETERDQRKARVAGELRKTREWLTLSAVLRDGRIASKALAEFRAEVQRDVEIELSGKGAASAAS